MHTPSPNKKHYSWQDIYTFTQKISEKISAGDWKPDIILGITRGGLIPAVILSNLLETEMRSWKVSLRDYTGIDTLPITSDELQNKNILIIDDLNDSGDTFCTIEKSINNTTNIRYAALLHNIPSNFQKLNYWSTDINKNLDPAWIVFPWEKQD